MSFARELKIGATMLAVLSLGWGALAAVRINEVMANNNTAARNGPDYPHSYVELYNDSANSVSLNGWYLTNNTNLTGQTKYAFPSWAVIQPYAFLMVWCNKETNGPGFYTGFDLKKETDEVGLYQGPTNALTLMDYIKFGIQITDLSISRVPDGSGAWKLTTATPGYENASPIPLGRSSQIRFNEWLANSGLTADDWFELFNAPLLDYAAQAVSVDSTTDTVTLSGNVLMNGDQVSFTGPVVPDGLIVGTYYYVVNANATGFQVSAAINGPVIDITSNGSGVTINSRRVNGPVDMNGLAIMNTDLRPKTVPPLSFINANDFALFLANRNGGAKAPANECDFRLAGGGPGVTNVTDQLILLPYLGAPASYAIHRISIYGQEKEGHSSGYLPDGNTNNFVYDFLKSTPGASNFQLITNVIINEVLAHTDPPLMDAIEFYNPTTDEIRLDFYYVSNHEFNPKKYQFPANSILAPLGYLVIYENDFNPSRTGNEPDFTLNSAQGDRVVLCSATNKGGPLTGYRVTETFGATANGISLGKFIKSDGKRTDLVPMSRLSFGTSVTASDPVWMTNVFVTGKGETNPYPLVGPIVFSEIMYHPPDIIVGTNVFDDSLNEYIELSNFSTASVPLYNPLEPTNHWSLTDGIEYEFPTGAGIPPRSCVLVVNFDPVTNTTQLAAFKAKWNVPADFNRFYGPYKGKLANSAMRIQLFKPDPAQQWPHPDAGLVPQVFVEKVRYEDQAPWPTNQVDGGGWALHRILDKYANDEINWFAAPPSPGVFGSAPVITGQPLSQNVIWGGAATFTVTAAGTDSLDPLRYHWQFNTQNLPGATTNYLALTNVQTNQAGGYQVVITNGFGAVTSQIATLTVAGQPVITGPVAQTNGNVQLAFSTATGFNYAVDGSVNLTDWALLATYTNVGAQVIYQQPGTNRLQFFRARLTP